MGDRTKVKKVGGYDDPDRYHTKGDRTKVSDNGVDISNVMPGISQKYIDASNAVWDAIKNNPMYTHKHFEIREGEHFVTIKPSPFSTILPFLKRGDKIHRESDKLHYYIYLDDTLTHRPVIRDNMACIYRLTVRDILANDWVVYYE